MIDHGTIPLLATATAATESAHFLGEGPVWDAARHRLLWVDILDGAIHTGRLNDDGTITAGDVIRTPDAAGAVAVAADGSLIVAGMYRLHYVAPDGALTSGRRLIDVEERRFNDGKPDPAGRFLVGTKGPGGELLIRIDDDEQVAVFDDDLTLSNGLAWTTAGTLLYSIDTLTRRIHVRDYDPSTGEAGPRRLFLELPDDGGVPDGMTIDAEDHLWVAIWGGGCVMRIDPTGRIVGRVDVPAPHTSSVTFAGPDLNILAITTALEGLDEIQRAAHPDSGRLFTARPGITGTPARLWVGTH